MADKKISALTGATTPLAGTEVLPIVQSGATVKVAVSDLTAGRAVNSAGGTFTDNLTQGTAAKGVNFTANTPQAGMTSQLLNWYEEGTWTPALTFATAGDFAATYSVQLGSYTRVGRMVTVIGAITTSSFSYTTASGVLRLTGLPFTSAASPSINYPGTVTISNMLFSAGYTQINIRIGTSSVLPTILQTGTGAVVLAATTANFLTGTSLVFNFSLSYSI